MFLLKAERSLKSVSDFNKKTLQNYYLYNELYSQKIDHLRIYGFSFDIVNICQHEHVMSVSISIRNE